MADRNLTSIPLPSSQTGSSNGNKKSAKEMLQRALEDHSKGSIDEKSKPSHCGSLNASTDIVDMLFKDFISKTSGKANITPIDDASMTSDNMKIPLPSSVTSSVNEINQILDMEIKSLTSGSLPLSESKHDKLKTLSSKSNVDVNSLKPSSNVSKDHVFKVKNKESLKSSFQPVSSSESQSSDFDANKDKSDLKSSTGNGCEVKKAESRVPLTSMLPLPLAKKAMVKTKMLDLKLSKESLSLIKEKTPVSGEEGEVFSSNSDESEKNGSDSDSEGLASEGGSAESGFQDDKKSKKAQKETQA